MTSKRQRMAGYLLPDVIETTETECLTFRFPKHYRYRAALLGQIVALGKWWTWEKSYTPGDDRATRAASLWRHAIHDGLSISDECGEGSVIQFRQDECSVEYSTDGGETWYPVADLSLCPPTPEQLQRILRLDSNGVPGIYDPVDGTWTPYLWGDPGTGTIPTPDRPPPGTAGPDRRCKMTQSLVSKLIWAYDELVRLKTETKPVIVTMTTFLRALFIANPLYFLMPHVVGQAVSGYLDNIGNFQAGGSGPAFIRQVFCAIYDNMPDDGDITLPVHVAMIQALQELGNYPYSGYAFILTLLELEGTRNAAAADPEAWVMACDECGDPPGTPTLPITVTFGDPLPGLPDGWPHYTVTAGVRIPQGGNPGPYVLRDASATMYVDVRCAPVTLPGMGSTNFFMKIFDPLAPLMRGIRMRVLYYAGDTLLLDHNGGWSSNHSNWQYCAQYRTVTLNGVTRILMAFYGDGSNPGRIFGIDHIRIN